ncbi:MAG: hypothetical protein RIS41_1524 [Actinomycetota bacterium]
MADEPALVRFDEFLDDALYGPSGFYTTGGRAGRRGDFITSPEVGPLFGAVLARWCDAMWRELGEPSDFCVYDLGAGPGTLARSILASAPECLGGDASRYVAVEVSAEQRARHPEGITSVSEIGGRGDGSRLTGVVIANELLDNVPFRMLVFDGGWRESWVLRDGENASEVLRDVDGEIPVRLPDRAPHGARVPWHERGVQMLRDVSDRLDGHLLVIDYMVPVTASLAQRPWREWLRTYRGQERGAHYLRDVGKQDVTTEVCVDQLEAGLGAARAVRSQAQFLQLWGIEELVEEGKRVWATEAARPGLRAMTMRSRVSEAEALLDPASLGSFTALTW